MIKKEEIYKDMSALAIVAHHDDETIWLGGFIMNHPEYNWTIFSLCRANDKDRAPKFKKVCRFLKARAIITNLEDEDKLTVRQTLPIIKRLIIENTAEKNFDFIFTHGANGEYGHPRHIGVHQAVKQLVREKKLRGKWILYFSYAKEDRKKFSPPIAKQNSEFTFFLSAKELAEKKKIMAKIYGFNPKGIDANYCTNPEAFKIIQTTGKQTNRRTQK